MNKNKLVFLTVCLFLVHFNAEPAGNLAASSLSLNKRVTPTEVSRQEAFLQEFNMLAFALSMYYMDTKSRLSKTDIKEKLMHAPSVWKDRFGIDFDIDNIDFGKKGFTRYYPFTLNGKDYIIRIFDTNERHYLEDFEVFYEGVFEGSNISFQIIPGIKTILASEKPGKMPINRIAPGPTYP